MTEGERTLLLAVATVLQREVALRKHRDGDKSEEADHNAIMLLGEGIKLLQAEEKAG